MPQVFISYSRKDIDFVRRLAADLQEAGLDVWWDMSEIEGSEVWEKEIEKGLASSQLFIAVLTPDSIASRWVRREYISADHRGIKILPLILRPCDVPLTLRDILPIDVQGKGYVQKLPGILRSLGVKLHLEIKGHHQIINLIKIKYRLPPFNK